MKLFKKLKSVCSMLVVIFIISGCASNSSSKSSSTNSPSQNFSGTSTLSFDVNLARNFEDQIDSSVSSTSGISSQQTNTNTYSSCDAVLYALDDSGKKVDTGLTPSFDNGNKIIFNVQDGHLYTVDVQCPTKASEDLVYMQASSFVDKGQSEVETDLNEKTYLIVNSVSNAIQNYKESNPDALITEQMEAIIFDAAVTVITEIIETVDIIPPVISKDSSAKETFAEQAGQQASTRANINEEVKTNAAILKNSISEEEASSLFVSLMNAEDDGNKVFATLFAKAYIDNKSWTLGQINTILGAQSLPSSVNIEQKLKDVVLSSDGVVEKTFAKDRSYLSSIDLTPGIVYQIFQADEKDVYDSLTNDNVFDHIVDAPELFIILTDFFHDMNFEEGNFNLFAFLNDLGITSSVDAFVQLVDHYLNIYPRNDQYILEGEFYLFGNNTDQLSVTVEYNISSSERNTVTLPLVERDTVSKYRLPIIQDFVSGELVLTVSNQGVELLSRSFEIERPEQIVTKTLEIDGLKNGDVFTSELINNAYISFEVSSDSSISNYSEYYGARYQFFKATDEKLIQFERVCNVEDRSYSYFGFYECPSLSDAGIYKVDVTPILYSNGRKVGLQNQLEQSIVFEVLGEQSDASSLGIVSYDLKKLSQFKDHNNQMQDMVIDDQGVIYISDSANNKIFKLVSGNVVNEFSVVQSPEDLIINTDGDLVVLERFSSKVHRLDINSGDLIASYDLSSDSIYSIDGIVQNKNNGQYAVLTNHTVEFFDNAFNFLSKFEHNVGDIYTGMIAVDNEGNIYIVNRSFQEIIKFDSNGNELSKIGGIGDDAGQFKFIYDIELGKDGNILVADYDKVGITIFDRNGNVSVVGSEGQDSKYDTSSSMVAQNSVGTLVSTHFTWPTQYLYILSADYQASLSNPQVASYIQLYEEYERNLQTQIERFENQESIPEGESCYWMENYTGNYNWVSYSVSKKECYQLDSCDGGKGQSGGGCYKWAESPDALGLNWKNIPHAINIESKLGHDDEGVFLHFPQDNNVFVYKRVDNNKVLYFYESQGCNGSWRTTYMSTDLDEVDPSSQTLGSGIRYPRYCFDSSDKFQNFEDESWKLDFYNFNEYEEFLYRNNNVTTFTEEMPYGIKLNSNGTYEEDGLYTHFPQEHNPNVYKHEDDNMILYFYEDRNNNHCQGDTGNWRTTTKSNLESVDPSSEYLGSGWRYPRYCFDSSEKYYDYSSNSWSIEFLNEAEYLEETSTTPIELVTSENIIESPYRFELANQQYVRTNVEDNESRYVKQRILSEFQGEVNVLEEISIDRNSQERLFVNKQYLVSKEDGLYMFNNGEWVKGISYPLEGSSQVLNDIDEKIYYNAQIEYISLYTDQHGVEFQDVYKFTTLIQESGESFDFYISKTGVQIADEIRIVESVFDDFVAENNVDLEALLQQREASEHYDQDDVDTEVSQESDVSSNVEQEVSEQISGHRFELVNQQYVRTNVEYNETQYVKQRILSEFQGEINVLEEIIVDRYLISGEERTDVYHNYLVSKEDGLYIFNNGEWVKGISYPLEGISQILNDIDERTYNNAEIEYMSSYTDQYGVEFQDVYKFTMLIQESGENFESNIDFYIIKTGVQIMNETRIEESVFDNFVAENNIDLNVNQNSSIGASSIKTKNNSSLLALFRFSTN